MPDNFSRKAKVTKDGDIPTTETLDDQKLIVPVSERSLALTYSRQFITRLYDQLNTAPLLGK